MSKYINVENITLPIDAENNDAIFYAEKYISENLGRTFANPPLVARKAIDTRHKNNLKFIFTVAFDITGENFDEKYTAGIKNVKVIEKNNELIVKKSNLPQNNRPVVIGFGPSGMFCSLVLAMYGYKPIIFELGEDMDSRVKTVDILFGEHVLNENSNVCFGEGGAGTFSDGKLVTRINDEKCGFVLETFKKFGADEKILYHSKPHVGTDRIRVITKNIRNEIVKNGGEIYFNSELTDIRQKNTSSVEITINGNEKIITAALFLGIGHSSYKTYSLLQSRGFILAPKPYSLGFRIEHKQSYIDELVYGKFAGHKNLSPAQYVLSYKKPETRGVYTFCMCPGGQVVNSSSRNGTLVTNGMSYEKRGDENANSAILATIYPEDYGNTIEGSFLFRAQIEKAAYEIQKEDFTFPVQTLGDYYKNRTGSIKNSDIKHSFSKKYTEYDINKLFPSYVNESIKKGISEFDKTLIGFNYKNAIISAPETRSSSAVRIERNSESLTATGNENVYPMGEGAGYAGGITSSATDGIRCALKYMEMM